jgi:HlyD family secretion protein
MTANISIYTREENNVMLVSARATKFRPDSSTMKKYTIVGNRGGGNRRQSSNGNLPQTAIGNNRMVPPGSQVPNDSSEDKKASVWVLEGTTLTRHTIITGLEDGVSVQVISGLSLTDHVVTGVEQSGATSAKAGTERSPFMPQRRNSGQSGGNRGGGGSGGRRPQ